MNLTFHNCKPAADSALVVSVGPDPATPEQLDTVTAALNGANIWRVVGWGQRAEPKPGTLIYSNDPDPVTPSSHDWRPTPIKPGDRVGLYLGSGWVAVSSQTWADVAGDEKK